MAPGELLSTEGLGLASQPLHMECDGATQPDLSGIGVGGRMGMVAEPSWGFPVSSKRHSEGIPYD